MKPTIHNTRALGNGDTIAPSDFWIIPEIDGISEAEFLPVEEPECGRIIDGSEFHEYRRFTQRPPIELLCEDEGILTLEGRTALAQAIRRIASIDQKQRDLWT